MLSELKYTAEQSLDHFSVDEGMNRPAVQITLFVSLRGLNLRRGQWPWNLLMKRLDPSESHPRLNRSTDRYLD
jgi:hypothetical protein